MRRLAASLVVGSFLVAGSVIGLGASAVQGEEPAPAPSAIPLTVIIPGPTGTPTPTPTPTSTTGGGSSGGGVTPTPAPTTPPAGGTAPTPPSQPSDDAAQLELDHETIEQGEWLTAIGTGYTPGEKVQFVLYPGAVVIGSFVTDPTGSVVARFKITDKLAPGHYIVEATGWQSTRVSNGTFLVTTPVANNAVALWWVWVVLGVLLLAILVLTYYYRDVIRGWFGGSRVESTA